MLVPVVLPKSSFTGNSHPQVDRGKLINCIAEPNGENGEVRYRRPFGLSVFSEVEKPRGFLFVPGALYVVTGIRVLKFSGLGGTPADVQGSVAGEGPVIMARNNAATPDIVIVSPGNGVFQIVNDVVVPYPDPDVGQPSSVVTFKSFFIFTYGDGTIRSSDPNSTNIVTTSNASTEYRPGTLYRAIPVGGVLMFMKSSSIEQWGGSVNETGFPFSYMTAMDQGLFGPYAVDGHRDGFGGGVYFVGTDNRTYSLAPFTAISPPELDELVSKVKDRRSLEVMCFTARGHQFVVVQSPTWTWVFDVSAQKWHPRQSYLSKRWRATQAIFAFDRWIVGDVTSGISMIDAEARTECGDPLSMIIETAPQRDFPNRMRVNQFHLYATVGVGDTPSGEADSSTFVPLIDALDFSLAENSQYFALLGPGTAGPALPSSSVMRTGTDPVVEIQFCGDGRNWSIPRIRELGRMGVARHAIRANNFGHALGPGASWRITVHDPVDVTVMGAAMDVEKLAA